MKRIIFIIFLLTGVIQAQEFGNPSFYDSVTSVNNTSTFQIRQSSQTKVLTWSRLNTLLGTGDSLRSANNTWSGENNFTNILQTPNSLSANYPRAIGYSSSLFAWVNDDTVRTGADRAWVLQQIADSGVAVDTNQFAQLGANQTFTGTNTFSTNTAIGGTNTGAMLIPRYTSTNAPSDVYGSMYFNSTNNDLYIYNGTSWKRFIDSAQVASIAQTGSYLQTSGTQSGLSSSLTWSSGTLTPDKLSFGGQDAGKTLVLPLDKNNGVEATEGSLVWKYSSDELWLHDGSSWLTIPDEAGVRTIVEGEYLNDTAPPDSQSIETVTLDWTDKNYSQFIAGDADGVTIDCDNYSTGWVAFYVSTINDVEIDFDLNGGTVTIEWIGGVAPDCTDGKYYKIQLEYYSSTVCLGSYVWYD